MQPIPPRLWKSTADMSPSEVFWVIKNGIKMTGMPSWKKEHNDRDIWDIVAFVKGPFPKLSPRLYAQMDRQAGVHDHEAGDADERGAGVEHGDAD
jgi:mono/diheme cytochrome c family protein